VDFITQGRFFFHLPDYEAKLLVWKNISFNEVSPILKNIHTILNKLSSENFHKEQLINEALVGVIASAGNRGAVLWPLRVALSGQAASPDPLDIMEVLGKTESLARIEIAIKKLESAA
jgi:glutamyl-tRNA synthetase